VLAISGGGGLWWWQGRGVAYHASRMTTFLTFIYLFFHKKISKIKFSQQFLWRAFYQVDGIIFLINNPVHNNPNMFCLQTLSY